jgi:hypothetical protein
MLDVSEKSSLERSAEGSASSSERLSEADQALPSTISTRDLIDPIFMRTVYAGVIPALLFAYLGSSNVLAPFNEQSQWLVSGMAPIWPALPAQYELVREVRGTGHAASYGFMCAALWAWPIICAVAFLCAHAKRGKEILPFSRKEIGQFIFVAPLAFLIMVFDQTEALSPLLRFFPDRLNFFYLRQWFFFSLPALVLAIVLYVVGRIVLGRTRRRAA